MLASERDHIQKVGKLEFHKRLILANMRCREDRRFVGLEKIRSQIAFQAALNATGYGNTTLKLVGCGPPVAEADELFAAAIEAARA